MALYRIQIFKTLGPGRKPWSNQHYVEAPTLATAATAASAIANIEKVVHKDYVQFVTARVKSVGGPGNPYTTVNLGFTGDVTLSAAALPLWNTVRVLYEVFGGRPSFNYYRLPVSEDDQASGEISPPAASFLTTNLVVPLFGLITLDGDFRLVDESGGPISNVTLDPIIRERQLFRRRRKKTETSGPPV